jgi:hypothetical protein
MSDPSKSSLIWIKQLAEVGCRSHALDNAQGEHQPAYRRDWFAE